MTAMRVRPSEAQPRRALTSLYVQQGRTGKAAEMLRRAQVNQPSDISITGELAAVYLASSQIAEAKDVAKALRVRKGLEVAGHTLEGDIEASQRDWAQAIRAYRTALKLASLPESAIAIRLCHALRASGNDREFSSFTRQWIEKYPSDVAIRMYVADVALKANDHRAAAREYDAVAAAQPTNLLALNNLAWALGKLNDPRALSVAQKAIALSPDEPSVLHTLGTLQLQVDKPSDALHSFSRASHLAPTARTFSLITRLR